jgi:hypothetical protein
VSIVACEGLFMWVEKLLAIRGTSVG